MHDPERYHKHPFVLETFYREMAGMVAKGYLSDPATVLKPMIDVYRHQEQEWTARALSTLPPHMKQILAQETGKAWWRAMPMVLPPFQSNHELSLVYALYRLMTTGNMAFMIGPELSTALHNTDFKVKMDQLAFPSDTFVIYYKDSSIPVYGSPLKWLFCDRVSLGDLKELRIVYGYIDQDGDYANSGFQLYTYQPEIEIDSAELFANMENERISALSQMEVTDEHRANSRNILTALFNFLLYLGAVGDQMVVKPPDIAERLARLTNPKKKRRLEKEAQSQTLHRYIYVGRNYEARLNEDGSGISSSSDLKHRVLVRGHWRHQWIGPQKDADGNRVPGTSQKLIWVEPYWKGPDVRDEKASVRVIISLTSRDP